MIITSETWKDKTTGEVKERTEWHRIVFFGKLSEIVGQYVHKGSRIYVEGSLRTEKYTDKQSIERWSTKIIASTMQMLDSRKDGQQTAPNAPQATKEPYKPYGATRPVMPPPAEAEPDYGGVPF